METACPSCNAIPASPDLLDCPSCGQPLDTPPLVKGAIEVGTLQDFLDAIVASPGESRAPARPSPVPPAAPARAPADAAAEPELLLEPLPDSEAELILEESPEESPATATHELTLAEGDSVVEDDLDVQTVVSRNPTR